MRDWNLSPQEDQVRVVLRQAESQKATFALNLRRNYEDRESTVVELPEIFGAKRLRGFVTVSPQTALRVEVTSATNLEVLAAADVPLPMKGDLSTAPVLAYRYLE